MLGQVLKSKLLGIAAAGSLQTRYAHCHPTFTSWIYSSSLYRPDILIVIEPLQAGYPHCHPINVVKAEVT